MSKGIVVNCRFLTQKLTGVQRVAIELCRQLHRIDNSLIFVAPRDILHKEVFLELGAIIIGRCTGHLWEQYDLPKWLQKNGYPLVVNLANTAPLYYNNKIVTIHDIAYERFPQSFSKLFLLYYKFLIPRLVKNSKRIITVSEFSKREISSCYTIPDTKISVVYNSVDSCFVRVGSIRRKEKFFLAVSSLNYRKNFIFILESFVEYLKRGNEANLYIVGDLKSDSFGKVDLSMYRNHPKIKILGRVSDDELKSLYSDAHVFLYPSLYEGFGLPPLEAQACGCPSICSDASCLPEIFGDSVLYCNPNDIDSMVCCMEQMDDISVRRDLEIKSQRNVKRYSWEKSAMILYNEIQQLKDD